jgi:hypothetical protein
MTPGHWTLLTLLGLGAAFVALGTWACLRMAAGAR